MQIHALGTAPRFLFMAARGTQAHTFWVLLFLALVLGAVSSVVFMAYIEVDHWQESRPMIASASVTILVVAAVLQWRSLRQLHNAHKRATAADDAAMQTRIQLNAALDILPDALALHDHKDRLVLCNAPYRAMFPLSAHLMVPGTRFEDLLRHSARAGALADAVGREEQWVQNRLAQHRKANSGILLEMAGDRWVRVTERRTPDGGTISLYTDVTEFMRNEHALHAARKETQLAQLQLHEALEAMPAGLEIYDEQDRLILYNEHLAQMAPHLLVREALGKTYEQLLRTSLAQGAPPVPEDQQDAWIADMLARRGEHNGPQVRHYPNGSWLQLHETRTPTGYIVCVRLDVTDLVLQRQALDASRQEAQLARELLEDAIETLPEAFALYDQDDRLVACNSQFRAVYPLMTPLMRTGQSFEEMLRHGVQAGQFPQAVGREDAWISEHMHEHHTAGLATMQQLPDQRWLRVHERRTRRGGIAGVRTDVTELVHKEQLLAAANALLAQLSTTDGLTGIGNRRYFDERLASEWQRGARQQLPLALLLIDIDHFKLYNDHYGHLAGDECLRCVAQTLASCVRRADEFAARYGGEEFVLLLPGSNLDAARAVAQRCLEEMARVAIPHAASPTASLLTLSIGIASMCPIAGAHPTTLIDAADAALFRAKKAGRNQFELFTEAAT